MPHSKYLIIGSSHAALEAAAAIRMRDESGALTLLTRDSRMPYSPTILPYIVSSQSRPEKVTLRDQAYFDRSRIALVRGAEVVKVDPTAKTVRLAGREPWTYERLLLATGATPTFPPVDGLADVPFHVLRTMNDAIALRDAMVGAKTAIVLGAGLCAMHAAENMAKAGVDVTVIVRSRVLREYFSPRAGAMIERAFVRKGVHMLTGHSPAAVAHDGGRYVVTLDDGSKAEADLLMVGTGVTSVIGYLAGSGIATDRGILVDDQMRTSDPNVWAAGDVCEARGFWGGQVVNGILPGAVEQGRTAGAAMAEDAAKPYAGAVPLNTYHFFDHHSVSVGLGGALEDETALEVNERVDEDNGVYRRIVLKDGRLVGISTINDFIDAGIMWRLILDRTDLTAMKTAFLAQPQETGRRLMSQGWR